jgi:hypothetical protein
MQESLWKKNLSLARGAFLAEEVDDFYHTLRLGELPHGTCLSYRTGSQRECLLAAFDSNKKIILVKKDGGSRLPPSDKRCISKTTCHRFFFC